jgi:hypothetical protein
MASIISRRVRNTGGHPGEAQPVVLLARGLARINRALGPSAAVCAMIATATRILIPDE